MPRTGWPYSSVSFTNSTTSALPDATRSPDEVVDVGLELGERLRPQIGHVAGLVIMELDVAQQRRRHEQMAHLHLAFEVRCRDIEQPAVDHHVKVGFLLHRGGEVR